MAKVTIGNLNNIKEEIRREFSRIKSDPKLLVQIGEVCVSDIVGYARSGKDPSDASQFPGLSESWVEQRSDLRKYNSTSEYFKDDSKSRLSFTGKLLESITYSINQAGAFVRVFAKGQHPGYKTKNGRTDSISNEKLVEYQAAQGRSFLNVSDRLRRRINVLTKRFIRELIKTRRL